MSVFPQTAWTVVAHAGQGSALHLDEFCRAYRQPIYSFARAKGLTHEDAEDLTQIFFASFLKRGLLEKADPAIGRLRNYLLKHFSFVLRDYFKARNAVSRGGRVGFVSLSTTFCDLPDQASSPSEPVVTEETIHEITRTLKNAYEKNNPPIPFAELAAFLPSFDAVAQRDYDGLYQKYPGLAPAALRKRVSRLRADFRNLLEAKVPALKQYLIKPRRDAPFRFEQTSSQGKLSPETIFNREWATCVLERARRVLRREYTEKYNAPAFRNLEMIFRGEAPDVAALRAQYPHLSDADVNERVTFLQRRLVEIRNAIVASTVASETELADEIRALDRCWLESPGDGFEQEPSTSDNDFSG